MKRIISLVLALSMVFSVFSTVFAARKYTDLTGENAKYAGAVEALTELGVVDGFTDNTFGPLKELTRAQLAKMLVICLGLGDSVQSLTGRTVFSDVEASHWASGYINAAAQGKVITGYPDGTFKPEKNVSYAEAFTMALRALGYGNVVEAEGTWPTAYMLKAVELELTDDMDGTIVAGNPATRGNTAILLWNMLRTPMWKIYEESQGNGMTLSNMQGDYMLNVKFPKYNYGEELYLTDIDVKDKDEVRITVSGLDKEGRFFAAQEGKLARDTDVSRLVLGMKVTALIKDYKDDEKATFLTLTPEYDFVEGLVTDTDKLESDGKVKIEGVEYKIPKDVQWGVNENEFVVAEVEGTKFVGVEGVGVYKVLPNEAKEATKSYIKGIDEDDLVIIDGKWASKEDVEEGDIITKLGDDQVAGTYYMVARERVEGGFEALTFEKDNKERGFFEVDGEEYRVLRARLERDSNVVYEGTEDPVAMDKADVVPTLTATKDNDYVDRDVELCMNYLGLVWRAYFGDAEATATDGNFWVVVSDGVREYSTEDSDSLRIKLANSENPEGKWFTFKKGVSLDEFDGTALEKGAIYADEDPVGVFVWAKTNDKDQITRLAVVSVDLASGDQIPEGNEKVKPYNDSYEFDAFGEDGYDKSDKYISGENGMYKVTEDTVVLVAVPIEDEDGDIDSFEFKVAEDAEAALNGADEGLVAWDTKAKVNQTGEKRLAKFVFVTGETEEPELMAGKVSKVRIGTKGVFAIIDKTELEVDMDKLDEDFGMDSEDAEEALPEAFILYTETNNDNIVVKAFVTPDMLVGAPVVIAKSGTLVKLSGDPVEMDTALDDDVRGYKKFDSVTIEAEENDDGFVEFVGGEYAGEGLSLKTFNTGDRVVIDTNKKVVYIVSIDGCDEKDTLEFDDNGNVIIISDDDDEGEEEGEDEPVDGNTIPSGDFEIVGIVKESAKEKYTGTGATVLDDVLGDIQAVLSGVTVIAETARPFTVEAPVDMAALPTFSGQYDLSYSFNGSLLTVTVK